MGGILITVKTPNGLREWRGHAQNVATFFTKKDISAVLVASSKVDRHNGTITIDPEKRTIIFDTDYFKLDVETVRFWKCLGFDVLGRLKGGEI